MAARFLMHTGQFSGRLGRDRAHRKVHAVLETAQDAVGSERHRLKARIVGNHRHHDAPRFDGLSRRPRENCSLFRQRPRLFSRAVVDAKAKAGLEQIDRHGGAHRPQADPADGFFHHFWSVSSRLSGRLHEVD